MGSLRNGRRSSTVVASLVAMVIGGFTVALARPLLVLEPARDRQAKKYCWLASRRIRSGVDFLHYANGPASNFR